MAKALVVVRLLHRDLACQVEDPKLTPTPDVLLERRGHGLLLRAVLPGTAGSFDESVVKGQVRSHGRPPLYTSGYTSWPRGRVGSILGTHTSASATSSPVSRSPRR